MKGIDLGPGALLEHIGHHQHIAAVTVALRLCDACLAYGVDVQSLGVDVLAVIKVDDQSLLRFGSYGRACGQNERQNNKAYKNDFFHGYFLLWIIDLFFLSCNSVSEELSNVQCRLRILL